MRPVSLLGKLQSGLSNFPKSPMTEVLSPLVSTLSVASKFIVFSGFRKKVSQQRRPSISTELRMSFSIFRETRHLSSQTRTLWRYLLWKNENNKKVYKP